MKQYATKPLEQLLECQKQNSENLNSKLFKHVGLHQSSFFLNLESIIKPVIGSSNTQNWRATRALEKNTSHAAMLCFLWLWMKRNCSFSIWSAGRMSWLSWSTHWSKLPRAFMMLNNKKISGEPSITKREATLCWFCENELNTSPKDPEVLDHCHFTGKFLGWAHSQCNLKRRNLNFTPLFVHNLTDYDLHHLVVALQSLNENNTISVVSSTSENLI